VTGVFSAHAISYNWAEMRLISFLVFLGLLLGHTDNFSELLLRHTKQGAAFAEARRHEAIDRCRLPRE